jgi:hypothetical protein
MADMSGNRAYVLTDTDRSGLVVIIATMLMSWMLLVFCFRLYTRSEINGPFGADDLAAGFGTVCTRAKLSPSLHIGVLFLPRST